MGESNQQVSIAIDAMGGDNGISVTIPGVAEALAHDPALFFELHGDQAIIRKALAPFPYLMKVSKIVHADHSISMDDKPSQALRVGRGKSGMWRSIEATESGRTEVTVSAGNTGALMAMSLFCLKRSAEVDRPALAGVWPTLKTPAIFLDLGASLEMDSLDLVRHATMGAAMARALFGCAKPRVGLLNIGEEEAKGLDVIQQANKILQERHPDFVYIGYVEGTGIGQGVADVIVSNGFTGNVALKVAEGTAKQLTSLLRNEYSANFMSKLSYLISRPVFQRVRQKFDPANYNGAVFLGLNGLVVKSHGNTTVRGYAAAIKMASNLARGRLLERIQHDIHIINESAALTTKKESGSEVGL